MKPLTKAQMSALVEAVDFVEARVAGAVKPELRAAKQKLVDGVSRWKHARRASTRRNDDKVG